MLRTNLSTRPFYNERAVHLLLGLAGLIVVVLTAFNAIRILSLSQQNTELSALINRDRTEAQRLTADARRIRAGIDQEALQATAMRADEANRLIDQRTFSWTEFFNRIEATLPAEVMLTAVQPSFDAKASVVQMTVLGRRTEDIDDFIEKLEGTGAFLDVLPAQQDRLEDGLHRVLLKAVYTSGAAGGIARPASAGADAPEAPSGEPPADPAGAEPPPEPEAPSDTQGAGAAEPGTDPAEPVTGDTGRGRGGRER